MRQHVGYGCSYTITVSLKPAYSSTRDAAVNFADSATGPWGIAPDTMFERGGSPRWRNCFSRNIPVTCTGVVPNISVTPGRISFGSVAVVPLARLSRFRSPTQALGTWPVLGSKGLCLTLAAGGHLDDNPLGRRVNAVRFHVGEPAPIWYGTMAT